MDEQPKKKPLSEIGHLFLSSVRDLNGAPRPQRIPPGGVAPQQHRSDISIDLTPEEFAQVYGNCAEAADQDATAPVPQATRIPAVTAIIGEHLNGKQLVRVKEYARHLSETTNQRVGLIELDSSEFRLVCFEPGEQPGGPLVEQTTDSYDPRMMAEAIEEMNFDVDRWLLLVPTPRVPEAAPLLKLCDHWLLLSTCDHDGVVSSYRMLKGVAELHRPRLSLAVLDALDASQAAKVHTKLSGVCQQFLDRSLEAEPPVQKAQHVCEHLVLLCRPTRDKAQLANPPQWTIVRDFLTRAQECSRTAEAVTPAISPAVASSDEVPLDPIVVPGARELVSEMVVPTVQGPVAEITMPELTPMPQPVAQPEASAAATSAVHDASVFEIVDLTSTDAGAEEIVSAVLKQDGGGAMLECPVRPPMCAESRLAVTRDRGVVLLAVAKRGLSELSAIGQAYRWLIENRALIGMAVPQLAIDAQQAPRLRLLVDECDAGAEVLRPMLTGNDVTVQSYRRVKWGGKAGLLLAAA
jgi:hypothetical protein